MAIVAATALYRWTGAPGLPDLPLAARADAIKDQGLALAIARIEAHLKEAPDDEKGWEVLGPAYMQSDRFADAARAFREALRLKGPDRQLTLRLGEALISAEGGKVTAEALQAQFYVALAAAQNGETDKALALFAALEASAPKDAPWIGAVRDQLAALRGGQAARSGGGDQASMIEGMVKGLADRLATKGGSRDEWLRLIRAYVVLNRPDAARTALADARKAYASDADALAAFDAIARELKIAS
jgi:cytochrome c-type biogenesis protein CcmH